MTEDHQRRLEWCERMLIEAKAGGYPHMVTKLEADIERLTAEIEQQKAG